MNNSIAILGIRGIPAQHGGFETFAEHFALYLVKRGWNVTVYCQKKGEGSICEDDWCGVHRVHIPVNLSGAKGTVLFDWKAAVHAAKRRIPVLTLGYNTAVFCTIYRLKRIKNFINMDGLEWRRKKWNLPARTWLYVNEKLGAWLGNHLIADHPEIKNRLLRFVSADKITVIPYSSDTVDCADERYLAPFGLEKNNYVILVARLEPENSILEIVRAYSIKTRNMPLLVLGEYNPGSGVYQKQLADAAGSEVQFVGAIYNKSVVQSLRYFARFCIHGHTVGGTNPSLVEALGSGSAVLAHGNKFNRWVAGAGAHYFSSETECARQIELLLRDDDLIAAMRKESISQFRNNFTWDKVYPTYEKIVMNALF